MLDKLGDKGTERLLEASTAEQRAVESANPEQKPKRAAHRWRKLARIFEFQGALKRFTAFNSNRQSAPPLVPDASVRPPNRQSAIIVEETEDVLDRLARLAAGIKLYSFNAALVGFACLAAATVVRISLGWSYSRPGYVIFIPAILATGLLAGAPAALAVGIASILIIVWAFIPPYFTFPSLNPIDQVTLISFLVSYSVTIFFAHCCRIVLWRLRQREHTNEFLTKELEHRSNNTFSVVEAIVQRTLVHDPQSRDTIVGRLRSVRLANELLHKRPSEPITIRSLLTREFAAYGDDRLVASGPEFEIDPEDARHAILLFHELATNAAKYGSLSRPNGRVFVKWEWNAIVCVINWREVGGPASVVPSKTGFGSQLIRSCVQALSGTIDQKFSRRGLDCCLTLTFRPNSASEQCHFSVSGQAERRP